MKAILAALIILASQGYGDSNLELPHIEVHEWGVLTLSSDNPVFSAVPGTPAPVTLPESYIDGGGEGLLRAPVLYFHGPAFSGTVTVKTNNGSIFDIYPTVPDSHRDHSYCSWTVDFGYEEIQEYIDYRGLAPGEWNYDLWREVYALSISTANGWHDKFLYYETAPEATGFLPYTPAKESLPEEYRDVEALVIRRRNDGIYFSQCTLGDVVYGGSMEFTEYTGENTGDILDVLHEWSTNILEADEVEALWNTWSSWILREYIYEPGYGNGLLLYMIPDELTEKLSVVSVSPDEVEYPVDIMRYLLVAMPLEGE